MGDRLTPEELAALYDALSPEERDELLQCLLIAAASGGDQMIDVIHKLVLVRTMAELIETQHWSLDEGEDR